MTLIILIFLFNNISFSELIFTHDQSLVLEENQSWLLKENQNGQFFLSKNLHHDLSLFHGQYAWNKKSFNLSLNQVYDKYKQNFQFENIHNQLHIHKQKIIFKKNKSFHFYFTLNYQEKNIKLETQIPSQCHGQWSSSKVGNININSFTCEAIAPYDKTKNLIEFQSRSLNKKEFYSYLNPILNTMKCQKIELYHLYDCQNLLEKWPKAFQVAEKRKSYFSNYIKILIEKDPSLLKNKIMNFFNF